LKTTTTSGTALEAKNWKTKNVPMLLQNRDASVALCFTYLGDAVWELFARQHLVLRRCEKSEKENPNAGGRSRSGRPPAAVKTLRPQRAAQDGWCSAVAMHSHLEKLLSLERGQFLTEEELAILKWGADYGHESRRRHSGVEHRDASALEALVAYLYLFDGTRLTEVLEALGMTFMDAGGLGVLLDGRVEATERALQRFDGGTVGEDDEDEEKEEDENENESEDKEDSSTITKLQLENEALKKEIEELKQKALIAQRAVRLKR
tara:strand:+ start:146 stop:934 length:789 start_codon:yes stop_codon:yes gene_type:complete